MKKEELQKAWQEVQDRLNIPERYIHETVSQYLEEKNRDLQLLLNTIPAAAFPEDNYKKKNK